MGTAPIPVSASTRTWAETSRGSSTSTNQRGSAARLMPMRPKGPRPPPRFACPHSPGAGEAKCSVCAGAVSGPKRSIYTARPAPMPHRSARPREPILRCSQATGDPMRFCSPDMPTGRSMHSVASCWWAVRADAGLGKLRIHDLRRTMASCAVMSGEKLLGQRRHQIAAGYTHLADKHLVETAERVESIIAESIRESDQHPAVFSEMNSSHAPIAWVANSNAFRLFPLLSI